MGFVNNIRFKKRPLPDKATTEEFTTKDLEFGCLFYEISEEGRLLKDNEDGSFTDMNFSGELLVDTLHGFSSYFMIFNENGFLAEVNEVPEYAYYSSDISRPDTKRQPLKEELATNIATVCHYEGSYDYTEQERNMARQMRDYGKKTITVTQDVNQLIKPE
ncbi:Uncharacterised protein [Yersinia intermedia]|uniref:hypothetical protein n=1 Tax=Yersinia TaxID=629 RepID=UPI0005DCCC1D|nr:hypothetical protein [Yersinia intermedia]EKN4209672.1 hypothetical protein [Yersinia ruckeri]CQE12764.1 Uncharacterised protein [Yersinia intermedia]